MKTICILFIFISLPFFNVYGNENPSLLECVDCKEIKAEGNEVIFTGGALVSANKSDSVVLKKNKVKENSIVSNKKIVLDILIGIFIATVGGIASWFFIRKVKAIPPEDEST